MGSSVDGPLKLPTSDETKQFSNDEVTEVDNVVLKWQNSFWYAFGTQ